MKNDGGPAYPGIVKDNSGILETAQGVTVRDYFAAKAMLGFLLRDNTGISLEEIIPAISKASYKFADAMIEERDN